MKQQGNGETEQCVYNLLRIVRGEVPFERLKGLGARIIDKPSTTTPALIRADAQWLAEAYEPRTQIDSIELEGVFAKAGHFNINAKTKQ